MDDAAQLGGLGRPLHRAGPSRDRSRVAQVGRRARAAAPRPRPSQGARDRRDRRSLRQDHPRARPAADHHRALLRRPVHAAPAEPRSRRRRRGHRHRRSEGRPHAPLLDPQVRLAGIAQPGQPQQGDAAHGRAVPVPVHERAEQGGIGRHLCAPVHPRLGAPVLPGRTGQLQPERGDQGRLQEPGPPAAAPPRGRGGPHLPAVAEQSESEAPATREVGHGVQGVPRALALHRRAGGLGGGRRPRPLVGVRARPGVGGRAWRREQR